VADSHHSGRRTWILSVTIVLGVALLAAAVWTDVQARTRARNEEAALAAANAHLA